MSFVFYDTETTGISTDFDQILQFAAIRTDADLREIDRFEMRCRLLPHVVPHPAALKVTGMSISQVTDPALPCHYELVRAIRNKLLSWSPSIFVGYNSMNFDEHLLRQALFRNLHPPYLTNTDGNCRADAMLLVQAATQFSPGCLSVPIGAKGKPVFKLDQLAPANGFNHANAHDALADVEATIHIARCVKDRSPACWSRFIQTSSKAGVSSMMASTPTLVLTEFYFNRPFHFVVSTLGADPDNPAAQLCLDLKHDLDWIAGQSPNDLATWAAKSPKPIRKFRTNAAPLIAPTSDVPSEFLGGLAPPYIAAAAQRLRQDHGLRQRLIEAAVASREEYEPSPHVEEQLYASFTPRADRSRLVAFHSAAWTDRASIVATLEDARLRYYGYRLIYERNPETLTPQLREYYRAHDNDRLMDATGTAKWGTLLAALAAIPDAATDASAAATTILRDYDDYLRERIAAVKADQASRLALA